MAKLESDKTSSYMKRWREENSVSNSMWIRVGVFCLVVGLIFWGWRSGYLQNLVALSFGIVIIFFLVFLFYKWITERRVSQSEKLETKTESEPESLLYNSIKLYDKWITVGLLCLLEVLIGWGFYSNPGLPELLWLVFMGLAILIIALIGTIQRAKSQVIYLVYRWKKFVGVLNTENSPYIHHLPFVNKIIPLPEKGRWIEFTVPLIDDGVNAVVTHVRAFILFNFNKAKKIAEFLPDDMEVLLSTELRPVIIGKWSVENLFELKETLQNSLPDIIRDIKAFLERYREIGYIFSGVIPSSLMRPSNFKVSRSPKLEEKTPYGNWLILILWVYLIVWVYSLPDVLWLSILLSMWVPLVVFIYMYKEVLPGRIAVVWSLGYPQYILSIGYFLIWPWKKVTFYDWENVPGDIITFRIRPNIDALNSALKGDLVELKERIANCSSLVEAQEAAQEFFYEVKEVKV